MDKYYCAECGVDVWRYPSHVKEKVYCSMSCWYKKQAGDVYPGIGKMCNKCNEVKPFGEYYADKRNGDGLRGICKDCHNSATADAYYKNHEKGKEKTREAMRTWRKNNPEKYKENRRRNYEQNIERCKIWTREYKRKLRKEKNPQHILSESLRTRLYTVVKRGYKRYKTGELVGCSWIDLKEHIEKQFQPGMCWENHGVRGWHIDHIKPCASFDLTDAEQQKVCFHYTNLQPLWARDNLTKGSR